MAAEEKEEQVAVPDSGAVFTFGKSKFAENIPSKFWLKNDKPVSMSCGDEHTALITGNGKLYVFGCNNWGQLGLGAVNAMNKPTCVKALKSEKVILVACGRNHTLAYTAQGKLYAAGGNNEGQLGLGDMTERNSFQEVCFFTNRYKIKQLAAGSNTSAALTVDGKLFMWGDNCEGQIGQANETNVCAPQQVNIGKQVSWVSCGYYHSAFVTWTGELYTFGEPENGKLGLPPEHLKNHRVPQLVPGISGKVAMVSCGGGHTVALTESDVYTFGLGQFGQLGHGTFTFEVAVPRPVEQLRKQKIQYIACGENHTAVITGNGLLYTFGDGRHGKLGLGEEIFTNQFTPTLCSNFLKFTIHLVACGGCHMLVFAIPRLKGVEEFEEDLKDNCSDISNKTTAVTFLQRSLSARHRRKEREISPEHPHRLTRTLPPLEANVLNATIPVSSTIPPRLPSMNHLDSKAAKLNFTPGAEAGDLEAGTAKQRIETTESSSTDEESENESPHTGLGDTVDVLNMTHAMRLNPSNKSLTLSPIQKQKWKNSKHVSLRCDGKGGLKRNDLHNSWKGSKLIGISFEKHAVGSALELGRDVNLKDPNLSISIERLEATKKYVKTRLEQATAAGRFKFAARQTIEEQHESKQDLKICQMIRQDSFPTHFDKDERLAVKLKSKRNVNHNLNIKSERLSIVTTKNARADSTIFQHHKATNTLKQQCENKMRNESEKHVSNKTIFVKTQETNQKHEKHKLCKMDTPIKQMAKSMSSSNEKSKTDLKEYVPQSKPGKPISCVVIEEEQDENRSKEENRDTIGKIESDEEMESEGDSEANELGMCSREDESELEYANEGRIAGDDEIDGSLNTSRKDKFDESQEEEDDEKVEAEIEADIEDSEINESEKQSDEEKADCVDKSTDVEEGEIEDAEEEEGEGETEGEAEVGEGDDEEEWEDEAEEVNGERETEGKDSEGEMDVEEEDGEGETEGETESEEEEGEGETEGEEIEETEGEDEEGEGEMESEGEKESEEEGEGEMEGEEEEGEGEMEGEEEEGEGEMEGEEEEGEGEMEGEEEEGEGEMEGEEEEGEGEMEGEEEEEGEGEMEGEEEEGEGEMEGEEEEGEGEMEGEEEEGEGEMEGEEEEGEGEMEGEEEEGEGEMEGEEEGEGEMEGEEEEGEGEMEGEEEEGEGEMEGEEEDEIQSRKEQTEKQIKTESKSERVNTDVQRFRHKLHSKQHVKNGISNSEHFWNNILPHYLTLK
uniref:X-linked retinitis pigmentosa GTPase regulator n=1 Tax=Geotrypetes seraphini TaxID=260995 RepID=A0A6P8R5I3_GEOSA|nr:X-linked retinitis pigmentosa GTPase regulator [Geotrypetes seraphini]